MLKQRFLIEIPSNSVQRRSDINRAEKSLIAVIACAIMIQLWLVFVKNINWDEFLHLGQVYDLRTGRLESGIQTLLTRLAVWTLWLSADVIHQIQAARILMLLCETIIIVFIVALVRQFSGRQTALLAGLVYVTAGYVFTQAFSYRPDPVAAAVLMGALYLFSLAGLSFRRAIAIGFLIGLAGAFTIKSVLYAPCFAGYAWLRWRDLSWRFVPDLVKIAVIPLAALGFFVALIWLHSVGVATPEDQAAGVGMRMERFVGSGQFQKAGYILNQAALAPLVTLGILMLPFAMRDRTRDEKIALTALVAPLLCVVFYRNTFPYFFTFLFPPICVALAPVLDKLVVRCKMLPLVACSIVGPTWLLANEPYETLDIQRATISEVERLFPTPTGYLSYSNFMPHYPRQFPSLLSGVGLQRYLASGNPLIADNIKAGRVGFIIVTGKVLKDIYGPANKQSRLSTEDTDLLLNNFLKHNENIRILGNNICPKDAAQRIPIYRAGPHSVEGEGLQIDGQMLADGETVRLGRGEQEIFYNKAGCIKLWALDHVPQLPHGLPEGPLSAGF
jgi:hypothetical protein